MSLASPLTFYLAVLRPPTVFTGLVNGAPSNPYMTINFDGGATGTAYYPPLPGMSVWFGSTAGAQDRGVLRLRSFTGGVSTGVISVNENDDIGPQIQDNDFCSIKAEFRLWPIYPRYLQNGTNVAIYEDYDVPYTDQTNKYKPVAVAGTPALVEFNGATAQALFVGDRSFALATSTTIGSYLWTAPGSVEGTSTGQGTEVSPVSFTWTSTGWKLVYLRVTDTNGKTATNYTWVLVVDPNNPTEFCYTDFDNHNDNFDKEQGGGSCSFTVHGNADVSQFPTEALVIMASRPTTPAQDTPTNSWPNRTNIHFVGYVVGNSIRQNPEDNDVTFQAVSIDSLMRNITAFPVSLTFKSNPQQWTQAKALNTDRAASFLWHYRSTLSLMAPIVPSDYSPLIARQDFGPGDLYSQLDSELMASLWGKVVVNHQGVVHHLIDYNLMNNTERAGVTTRKTLQKGVWVDNVTIQEQHAYSLPANSVKMSGIIYGGGLIDDVCPLFSEAPGDALKPFGREQNYDRLILSSQGDLNIRCGRALAKFNAKYAPLNMRFINDGSFTIAPQELFPSNIEAADNNRGLAFTTPLIPRSISRQFNHETGIIFYDIGFEPETDGPAGITVDLDCSPPPQKLGREKTPIPPNVFVIPPAVGYVAGGNSPAFVAITDLIIFATEIIYNATLGALSSARGNGLSGLSDRTRYGYFLGGQDDNDVLATADRVDLNTAITSAYEAANLSQEKSGCIGITDASRENGYTVGGVILGGIYVATADKTAFFSGATSADSNADLSLARALLANVSDGQTYGYFLGGTTDGGPTPSVIADRIAFTTGVTAASVAANLTVARFACGGVSSPTFGYIFSGGYDSSTDNNTTVDKLNFSTGVTASSLVTVQISRRGYGVASNNQDKGYIAGGTGNTGFELASAERLTFATDMMTIMPSMNLSTEHGFGGSLTDGAY